MIAISSGIKQQSAKSVLYLLKILKSSTMSTVTIDGSLGEGGGQVLRIALSLSVIYGIPVKITNIRAKRPKPGLAAQHLKGVELLRDMCNAKVSYSLLGSTYLSFIPGSLNSKEKIFSADTQTAGCISLLAQVAIPCALFMPSNEPVTLILKGGTNVSMGPHIEYLTEVFKPYLNKFGADFDFTVVKRGYYPQGGGEVHLHIKPIKSLKAITLTDPGIPNAVTGWAFTAGSVNINEGYKMKEDCKNTLLSALAQEQTNVPINIEVYKEERSMAVGNESGINIVCETTTGCVFGGSGLRMEKKSPPGILAAKQILEPLSKGACVDEHMQDQLIILMALADGVSKIRINNKELTQHTDTAIKIAEIMLADQGLKFNLAETRDSNNLVINYDLECKGTNKINSAL
ncbi:RNA 3'-terminal phosphate cyclase-like [Prorops nasuta]|uniref:RNA 3'-terminal phosphate cyclase-like n=1 Tax=Prorops nasuta TaxID=863751 RepID=UPI0034D02151